MHYHVFRVTPDWGYLMNDSYAASLGQLETLITEKRWAETIELLSTALAAEPEMLVGVGLLAAALSSKRTREYPISIDHANQTKLVIDDAPQMSLSLGGFRLSSRFRLTGRFRQTGLF